MEVQMPFQGQEVTEGTKRKEIAVKDGMEPAM